MTRSPFAAELESLFVPDGTGGVTLLASRCRVCGRTDFPARRVCVGCLSRDIEDARLSGRGSVHESTTVTRPPDGFQPGYVVGMIDLEEGPRVFGLLLAPCPHGARVRAVASRLPSGDDAFAFAIDDV